MKRFGLIGYPLTHSFSKRYFSEKFEREQIKDSRYDMYELSRIEELAPLLTETPGLIGLNVTIPYKQAVIPFLDELDPTSAGRIGAVNTIKRFADGSTKGYNTDYYGFRQSLEEWIQKRGEKCADLRALVLGNGGAAKAVKIALEDLGTPYQVVTRRDEADTIRYADLDAERIATHRLIINTTPLGMYPHTTDCPPIPYEYLGSAHLLYDLVYNPLETLFLKRGLERQAAVHNGLKMLELQAEKSWEIWTKDDTQWYVN
jgi:shikimate dehydrogenase